MYEMFWYTFTVGIWYFCTTLIMCVSPVCGGRTVDYGSETKICLLRKEMRYEGIAAYIVADGDEHQNKYFVHPREKRREWLTDLDVLEGTAVVTMDKAALWTTESYWKIAEESISDDWILMKSSHPLTPSVEDWLIAELSPGDKVSVDSSIDYAQAAIWNKKLRAHNIFFAPLTSSLIDMLWKDQPPFPKDPVYIVPIAVAGQTSFEKLRGIREDMSNLGTDLYVVTALDEIAWITNLRGSDFPDLPLFNAYMLIGKDFASLYVSREKRSSDIEKAVGAASISLHDYDHFWHDLETHSKQAKHILLPEAYSTARGVSYEVYITVPEDKIVWAVSPALLRKDKKNMAEVATIKKILLEDAARHIRIMMNIEKAAMSAFPQYNKTGNLTEFMRTVGITAIKEINERQKVIATNDDVKGRTDKVDAVTLNYLPGNDSSSMAVPLVTVTSNCRRYAMGTHMARTFVPVNGVVPTQKQILVYTALLAGSIDLAKSVFSTCTSVKASDFIIRAPLYKMGLKYENEVIQGFGLIMGSAEAFKETYNLNMFRTENIGYVEENKWIMRINNVMAVVPANTTFKNNQELMTFEMVTLLPFERKLIDTRRLTNIQLWWLNRYHREVRAKVGAELYRAKDFAVYEWLLKKTALITRKKSN